MRKLTVLQRIIWIVIITAAVLCIIFFVAVHSYDQSAAERRALSEPETAKGFEYLATAYERFKDNISVYEVPGSSIIAFKIDIHDGISEGRWLEIVTGFAEDINRSGQQISLEFSCGYYSPYYIEISNCRSINEEGLSAYADSSGKLCYVHFNMNNNDYDMLDMITALNADYVSLGSQAYIENDLRAFVDTLTNTDAQKLLVACQFYYSDEDEAEAKKEYQQTLQALLPDIDVFCK